MCVIQNASSYVLLAIVLTHFNLLNDFVLLKEINSRNHFISLKEF